MFQKILIKSIKEITPDDCFQTKGSRPLRVFCSDFNFYICKYYRGDGPAYSLFNEYIASCLLKVWELRTPETAFVSIKREHISEIGYPYYYFDRSCFGSQYQREYIDVDNVFQGLSFPKSEIDAIREVFLEIAFFDIWLSNEDRSADNYNPLYDISGHQFIPIDHTAIFNGNNLDKEPAQITENESILFSPVFCKLFYRTLQSNVSPLRLKVINSVRAKIQNSHDHLSQILAGIPPDWRLDSSYLTDRLAFLFTDEWISECEKSFDTYLQISLNHR